MKINTTHMSEKEGKTKVDLLKVGIDMHSDRYVIVCQEGSLPLKSAQRFTPEGFFNWISKQRERCERIVTCYEAGCFGYVAHRRLQEMGIENLVVRPRDWDEYGQKVKTDARDARELCGCLDRYLGGNTRALTAVRVPTEKQERERSLSRQRETLEKERKGLQNVGISSCRYYGIKIPTNWWRANVFEGLKSDLEAFLIELLEPLQRILEVIHLQHRESTAREERTQLEKLPTGLGALSASILDSEIGDYNRFKNRREVASYTGLCPSESSSANKRRQGSVNKAGNPRIRHILLEAVWRMYQFQPDYHVFNKWKTRFANKSNLSAAMKIKVAVAIARQFMVDWWRIKTGRMQAEAVGLQMSYPSAYASRILREQGRITKIYS